MRNARTIMLVAAVAALIVVAGCQKVSVMDEKGKAIAFAKVQVTSHNGEGTQNMGWTNSFGDAFISTNLTDPEAKESLIVSKDGYATRTVNRTKDSDITVTLQSTAAGAKSTASKKTPDSTKSKED